MKLIVFDVDGTLTRTNEVDAECFIGAAREVLGIDDIEEDWSRYQFVTDAGIAQEISLRYRERPLAGKEMRDLEEAVISRFRREPVSRFQEVQGAARFLKQLTQIPDFGVAVATGAFEGSARLKLELAGIGMDGIPLASSSDAVVREHIMLRSMDRASELHGKPVEKVTYFGDASWDVEASVNLGWDLVGIGSEIETPKRFEDYTDPDGIMKVL